VKKDGLERVLEFLAFLQDRKIEYTIGHERPEALLVSFGFAGQRVEVEFFVEGVEYSVFKGDESVESDEKALLDLVDRHSA
jgi:hypothetical protein